MHLAKVFYPLRNALKGEHQSATCYDCRVINARVFTCQVLFTSLHHFKAIIPLDTERAFVRAYMGLRREIVVTFNTNQESAFCTGIRGHVP